MLPPALQVIGLKCSTTLQTGCENNTRDYTHWGLHSCGNTTREIKEKQQAFNYTSFTVFYVRLKFFIVINNTIKSCSFAKSRTRGYTSLWQVKIVKLAKVLFYNIMVSSVTKIAMLKCDVLRSSSTSDKMIWCDPRTVYIWESNESRTSFSCGTSKKFSKVLAPDSRHC